MVQTRSRKRLQLEQVEQPSPLKAKTPTMINDLPVEMFITIMEYLSLDQVVVNCAKTCVQWKEDIGRFILGPKLRSLAMINKRFKVEIEVQGWNEECSDVDFIFSLYDKYEQLTSK